MDIIVGGWAPSNVRRVISKGPARRRYIALWSGRRALDAAITSATSQQQAAVVSVVADWAHGGAPDAKRGIHSAHWRLPIGDCH